MQLAGANVARGRGMDATGRPGWGGRPRAPLILGVVLVSVLLVAACNVSFVLTPDGTDSYQQTGSGNTLTISAAPGNTGGNLREAIWDTNAPTSADSQSCATWQSEGSGVDQQGIALHITDVNNVVRAVTVTKNIWDFAVFNFNLHVWDTSQNPQFTEFGYLSFQQLLYPNNVLAPFPWHVCARVLGSKLQVKVWLNGQDEPAWDDPLHSGSATVPDGWQNQGQPGWYIGHLQPQDSATYTDLSTAALNPDGSIVPPATTSTTAPTSTNTGNNVASVARGSNVIVPLGTGVIRTLSNLHAPRPRQTRLKRITMVGRSRCQRFARATTPAMAPHIL